MSPKAPAVFITGRREQELAVAVKEIGRDVIVVHGGVSNLGDLDHLCEQIEQEKGRLDVVFANAGVPTYFRLGTITEEFYYSIFDIASNSVVYSTSKAAMRSFARSWTTDLKDR